LGPDTQTVYNGALILPYTGTAGNYEYLISFQTPFTFDPTGGNLLVDFQIPSGTNVTSGFFFTVNQANTNGDGLAVNTNPFADTAIGTLDTSGPLTQFDVTPSAVPEPSSTIFLLAGIGVVGATRWRRNRASCKV